MPRMARFKRLDAVFHVMCRSISEVDLFKDEEDKLKYLFYVKKYQILYKFKVYGYCLMDNHTHFIIDANGSDVSKIMHAINFSYAQYFNRRHKRHGHLFQGRFKSKIVQNNRYLLALSAYIHNNPININQYKTCPERYPFSSLSIYLSLGPDPFKLVDKKFILKLFGDNSKKIRKDYSKSVFEASDEKFIEEAEFVNEETEYRSERTILVRNFKEEDIVKFIASKMDMPTLGLHAKHSRNFKDARALLVFLMRSLCNIKCSDICSMIGNITQARVSVLSSIGIDLIQNNPKYDGIVDEFIKAYSA